MPEDAAPVQVWDLPHEGHTHRVEVRGSIARRVRWYVDDDLVADKRSGDDTIRLTAKARPELGALAVKFSGLGKPRRATLLGRDAVGLGGVDLEPEAGSPAAEHEDRLRAHPRRYALVATLGGVASIVVPIVVVALLGRFAFSLPLPDWDLPRVPWPDLPSPDLPSVPWPDWSLPGWLTWALDHLSYVWAVVLAYVLARGEIRRRHKQDELRAERAGQRGSREP